MNTNRAAVLPLRPVLKVSAPPSTKRFVFFKLENLDFVNFGVGLILSSLTCSYRLSRVPGCPRSPGTHGCKCVDNPKLVFASYC